jgi:type II secretory pathway component PulJ
VRAFTLIEMILAVGITAVVMVAVTTVFFTALHLRNATQALVDSEVPLETTSTILRRDLRNVMSPTTNGILTGDFKVGNVSSPGIGVPVAIEMYTTTAALSANEPWGEVQKVTYELRNPMDISQPGKDLYRSVTRNVLATASVTLGSSATPSAAAANLAGGNTGTIDVEDQWMMGGVADFSVSCYDGNQWQTAWDTTNPLSANTNLPLAVRVDIQLAGETYNSLRPEPMEFLVPIDSMSRTNF